MSELTDVVGIGLAGGQGVRARPLTLKAPGYLRSEAAMSFLGRRLLRWVRQLVEKPSLGELREHFHVASDEEFGELPLLTNAGFYLIDTERLRALADHPEIAKLRKRRLDFGKDLLPWLVGNGEHVQAHAV